MKEIEKPDTVRKCPRCFGKFEFDAKEDLLWKSGDVRELVIGMCNVLFVIKK